MMPNSVVGGAGVTPILFNIENVLSQQREYKQNREVTMILTDRSRGFVFNRDILCDSVHHACQCIYTTTTANLPLRILQQA